MFLTMLGEAVRTLKGEEPTPAEEEPTVDLRSRLSSGGVRP